jgi:hypothetical protein
VDAKMIILRKKNIGEGKDGRLMELGLELVIKENFSRLKQKWPY